MKRLYRLALILLLALFLRWWRLGDWFHFTMDEELIAWRAWGLFNLKRPFLIGGISPLQVHLPPYFYYFSALLLWPFKFDPVGWGFWAGIFSLGTIFVLYRYSKSLMACLFYAVSLTAVAFDRHFWPLFFNPLFTLLTLWFLKTKNYLGLILTLTAAVTSDPSNLVLILFVLLYRLRSLRYWWLGAGLLAAPLLAFDLRHNWQNLGGIGRLFESVGSRPPNWSGLLLLPQSLSRFWFSAQTNLIEIYSYCRQYASARLEINLWLLLVAATVIIWAIKQFREYRLLLVSYFIGLGLFGLLGFSVFDHYLTGLMPVWALITAQAIGRLPRKLGYAVITGLVIANLNQFSRVTNPYGLKYKKELIKWANQYLAGANWELESQSKCHRENGLRYLFELSGNPPMRSFMDENFAWLYPQQPSNDRADKILLVTDRPLTGTEEIVARQTFGAMGAYLLQP